LSLKIDRELELSKRSRSNSKTNYIDVFDPNHMYKNIQHSLMDKETFDKYIKQNQGERNQVFKRLKTDTIRR
jgi:hypothetical protein